MTAQETELWEKIKSNRRGICKKKKKKCFEILELLGKSKITNFS